MSPGVPLGLVPEEDVGGEEGDGAVVGGHHLQQDPLDWGPMNRSSLPVVPLMRQFYATLSGAQPEATGSCTDSAGLADGHWGQLRRNTPFSATGFHVLRSLSQGSNAKTVVSIFLCVLQSLTQLRSLSITRTRNCIATDGRSQTALDSSPRALTESFGFS